MELRLVAKERKTSAKEIYVAMVTNVLIGGAIMNVGAVKMESLLKDVSEVASFRWFCDTDSQ